MGREPPPSTEYYAQIAKSSVLHFDLWLPLVLAALMAVFTMPRRPRLPGHCAACTYDLRGNTSKRCPECGTPFTAA